MKAIIIFFIVAPMFSIQSYGQNKYYEKAIAWEPWVQVAGRVNFDTDTSMTLVGGSFASLTSPERVNMVFCDQYAENRTVLTYGEGFGKFVGLDMTPTPFGYAIVGWMTDTANLTYAYPYL
ncbi:MAG: hypothetical protein IT273_06515, partial [Chitinophagales bacterium]|nr:hypothetical protein [Chitinophagales bacterium]